MEKQMNELLPEDIHYCVRFIPRDLRKLIIDNRLMVAGGFVRSIISGEMVNDIDLFGPSVTTLRDVAGRLGDKWSIEPIETKNAITIAAPGRKTVQFITRWLFSDPDAVINSFDFTIAQAALFTDQSGEWNSRCSDRFYPDLAAKRLVYTSPVRNEDAGGSMLRVQKFVGRGYHISPANLALCMARLAERVRWDHPIVSDEMGKARVFTSLLRQVDPLLAIDGVEIAEDEQVRISEIRDALNPTMFSEEQAIPDAEVPLC